MVNDIKFNEKNERNLNSGYRQRFCVMMLFVLSTFQALVTDMWPLSDQLVDGQAAGRPTL